ncbi:ATP-binding cassette domain-containing protein [Microbacterium horticulturae]|uniref:ATP-binding cassette domain-containing protein n=1 Tax=Microbacterium horticulturae TaxID=3028316 RepID=A0ABY8C0D8_9MICO|nr:ATP-binding cassette domain-containing protein [Microbacterium sp. KACC 23027]WEG08323.1 ATP-binding cassette domain-containing protein [Microbacterium sp. KACC 23027]
MADSLRPAVATARGWGWRHAGRRRWAVSGLDLDIPAGQRVLLLGASGAGKSTLLRALAGVLGDEEDGEQTGSLLVDGAHPASARGRTGLVLQDPDAQVVLARVGDDIAFACENLGVPRDEIWKRVDAAIDAVGLSVGRDHPTAQLSGGQKQRLALAGILAMQPGLVLLDEPTANLDPEGAVSVRDAVLSATRGATLVVVEHRVDLWAAHMDRVIVLGDEGLIADGAPGEVFARFGSELTEAGVWVPGAEPWRSPRPRRSTGGDRLLEARGLAVGRRAFGQRMPRVVASRIDLSVDAGRALALTGPNGAGKSTLALTVAGLLPHAGGGLVATEALRDGAGPDPVRWRSRELLTRIGMVFQEPEHQLLTARVRDELAVGPRALGIDGDALAARVDPLLERLRLARLAAVNPFTLSGGEKRRLTVAAALATRPRVLVLDEPTYGQDARTWRELADLIDEVRDAGTAVVFVTHDPGLVDALADDELRLDAALAPGGVR